MVKVVFTAPNAWMNMLSMIHLPERTAYSVISTHFPTRLPRVKCDLDGKVTVWGPFATPQTFVIEKILNEDEYGQCRNSRCRARKA